MNTIGVRSLGYLGVDATDIAAWRKFATVVFGMEISDRHDGGIDLRIDEHKRRIAIRPAAQNGVAYIGWDVGDEANLAALEARLREAGVGVVEADELERRERGVRQMIVFSEPHTGARYECFYGAAMGASPFRSSKPISGYKTGSEGLGHVMLAAADREAAVAFHRDVLGFAISDHIDEPPIHATFMHCNTRHHTLAIVDPFGPVKGGDFGHLMLEALALDDVGAAHDVVKREGYDLHLTFGKHSNDHMYSFYVYSPSGFPIEYGYGGRAISPNWQVSRYPSIRVWGHEFVG